MSGAHFRLDPPVRLSAHGRERAEDVRVKEINDTRAHYGYRRVHVMLRREGHMDSVKRVYRLYR